MVLVGLGYLYKCEYLRPLLFLLSLTGVYFTVTQDESAVTAAWGIMDSVIADMTINGGLREACETDTVDNCNTDQTVFKVLRSVLLQFIHQGVTYIVSHPSDECTGHLLSRFNRSKK